MKLHPAGHGSPSTPAKGGARLLLSAAVRWRAGVGLLSALCGCGSGTNTDTAASDSGRPSAGGATADGSAGIGGATTGGTSGAGGSSTPPRSDGGSVDAGPTLPPRPAWDPGAPLGTTGWRDSTVPFCSKPVGGAAARVWSRPGMVYALVTTSCNDFADPVCTDIPNSAGVQILYENDGSGWKVTNQTNVGIGASGLLVGYPGGGLVVSGDSADIASLVPDPCDVTVVGPTGTPACISSAPRFSATAGGSTATDLLLLGRQYAADPTTTKLLQYDGKAWSTLVSWAKETDHPAAVATAGSAVLVAGSPQIVWAGDISSGSLAPVPDVPAGDYTSGWIYGLDDIVVGNAIGQILHYDGATWTTVDTGLDLIVGMWGALDHTLFAHSRTRLIRLQGTKVTPVWSMTGAAGQSAEIIDMWGNSSSEVFFTVKDFAFAKYACGTTFLLWFDGTAVHPF